MEIVIGLIIMLILAINYNEKEKSRKEANIYTTKGYPKAEALVVSFDNVPQGVQIFISCDEHSVKFKGNGVEKSILHKDIINMTLETISDDANPVKFSYGKAIAGMVVLGSIGAIAGLSGKKRHDLKMLVVSYREGEKTEYITLVQKTKDRGIQEDAYYLEKSVKEMKRVITGKYKPEKLAQQ